MGLFDFIRGLFGGGASSNPPDQSATFAAEPVPTQQVSPATTAQPENRSFRKSRSRTVRQPQKNRRSVSLRTFEYRPSTVQTPSSTEIVSGKPYPFALTHWRRGVYLDLSQDADTRWLEYYGLPNLKTPQDLADWLGISIGKLAWLSNRLRERRRPESVQQAHYNFHWRQKRLGGWRLIEAPKMQLQEVQEKILRGILDLVPAHPAAHGFVAGRSILSNAVPHVGSKFMLKLDLDNFYPAVRYSRVVAIFRSLGYSREVALWLAGLTVTCLPWGIEPPGGRSTHDALWPYIPLHLPQGAPTSPALANLSAFALDVRLSGMAKAYNLRYTRYADDLTFSGPGLSIPALQEFIPLISSIIKDERFSVNRRKRKVIRNSQRQMVTGVVVNEKVNVSRPEYDRLKATLHNCIRFGPTSQNREQHPNFAHHLRGRIAHVLQLNPQRGEKLLTLFNQIRW